MSAIGPGDDVKSRDPGTDAVNAFEKVYAENDEERAERIRDSRAFVRKQDFMEQVRANNVEDYDRLREQFVELEKRAKLEAVKRQWQEGKFPGDWGVLDPMAPRRRTVTTDRTNQAPASPPAPQPKPFVEPAKGRAPIAAGEETP